MSFSLPYHPPDDLLREWQALTEKLCASYEPPSELLREYTDLQQAPSDRSFDERWRERELKRMEGLMDVRHYRQKLDERMNRLCYSGAVGPRTMCLGWHSDFTDTCSGVTTYRLGFATGRVGLLLLRPLASTQQSVPETLPRRGSETPPMS